MRHTRFVSVVVATLLQLAPLTRTLITMLTPERPGMAIIFRWAVGAAAMLGGYDAVSGASTVITSPSTATGTNGVPFSFRLTTGPQVATSYTAAPLPPGLVLVSSSGKITGTPTQVGITIATVQGCDGGNGCTPTATLTITIVAGGGGATAPSITTQPASQTVTAGANVSFSVVASGTAPLSYQWRLNGANIAGATSATYAMTNVQSANAGTYSVAVSNAAGTAISANATLTVNPAPVAPAITTQPATQTVTAGANVSFSVIATGTAPLTYQWRFNGANIAGATSATYTMTNVQSGNAGTYAVLVSNVAGSVVSANVTLTVNPASVAPAITTQPATQTVTTGANVSFSVIATGTAPLAYQWRFNGANIVGASSASYVINNVQSGNAGTYSVLVSNVAGSVTSANATLTVNPAVVAPAITTQPASQTVTAGANVSFTVVATGTSPLSYQWRLNGANVAGATSATLNVVNVQAADAGLYSVVVSNSAGTATSANATLTVNPAPVAPSIITQPATQTVTAGANVSFSVTATGTAPLAYQWRFNGANVAGATSATYTMTNVQSGNAGAYSVLVSNVAGSATSANASLTVNTAPVAPTFTTQPVTQTVTAGANVSFSVIATGTAPLTYQWRYNGANIAGATSATFALTNVQSGSAGTYSVLVSNVAGSVTSANATLTVNPAVVAPAITTQPVSQSVVAGSSASFTVVATGTAPLSYQWRLNGASVAGATGATLNLANVQAADAGPYSVVVSNFAGSVTSANATLTVNPAPVAPAITTQPASQTVTAGANVSFSVVATGTAPLSYRWHFNGADITGATSATYAVSNVQSGNAGTYSVLVSNAVGSVTSAAATLTVNPTPIAPAITTQPASQTATVGDTVSFSVVATGTAPLSYQWRFNGANIAGATIATCSLSSVQAGNAGAYSVTVSNVAGSVNSANATLTVNAAPAAPSITSQPVSRTVNVGGLVTFTVTATGTAPLTYQWQYNGADVAGATSASLALANVQTSQAGSYSVSVANALGSVTSAAAVLTVQVAAPDLKGTYSGLFYPADGATLASSGFVEVRVLSSGRFRGKLTMNNLRTAFAGQFDPLGAATATVTTRDSQVITVAMQLDLSVGSHQLTGTISDGTWTATITANAPPVSTTASPFAGSYQVTLSAPGESGGGDDPEDLRASPSSEEAKGLRGSVAAVVDQHSRLRMNGKLNNGKKLAQRVSLSADGDWPVWTSLGSDGALLGWLGIIGPTAPVEGSEIFWLHPDGTVTPLTVSPAP